MLSRVEPGANWDDAVALQRQFSCRATGQPTVPTIPKTPIFDIEALLGVEVFEAAEVALESEADINPGMEEIQHDPPHRASNQGSRDPCTRRSDDPRQSFRGRRGGNRSCWRARQGRADMTEAVTGQPTIAQR